MPGVDRAAHANQVKNGNVMPATEHGLLIPGYLVKPEDEAKVTYLESHGWVRGGTNGLGELLWEDPQGLVKEGYDVTFELPNKEGAPFRVRQHCLPPGSWFLRTDAAVSVQFARDNEAKDVRLARKRGLLAALAKEVSELEAQAP